MRAGDPGIYRPRGRDNHRPPRPVRNEAAVLQREPGCGRGTCTHHPPGWPGAAHLASQHDFSLPPRSEGPDAVQFLGRLLGKTLLGLEEVDGVEFDVAEWNVASRTITSNLKSRHIITMVVLAD